MFRQMIFVSALVLSGCASQVTMPSLAVKLDANSFKKQGTSQQKCLFGIFCSGELSVTQAMDNGKLNKAHHIELKSFGIPIIFESETLIVYGE